jgi:hypothetical protein
MKNKIILMIILSLTLISCGNNKVYSSEGDANLGFSDKNTGQGYVNLDTNALNGDLLIFTDANETAHRTSGNEDYANMIAGDAVQDWNKFSSINSDYQQSGYDANNYGIKTTDNAYYQPTQAQYNQQYNPSTNSLLKQNTNDASLVGVQNRDNLIPQLPDATIIGCAAGPAGCAAGAAVDVGELLLLGATMIAAKEAGDIIKEGFDSHENNGSILSTPANQDNSANILSTPINENDGGNILSTPVVDNEGVKDQGFGVGSDVPDTSILYSDNHVLGENGPTIESKTLWNGSDKDRIDVENSNPGQRPGQIHYQDDRGNKYIYDPKTNSFPTAPKSVNKKLSDPKFKSAIDKGMKKYLGE